MRVGRWLWQVSLLVGLQLSASVAEAIDASNVLVLYNPASSTGAQIANYYSQLYPGVRLLGVTGVATTEDISADAYLSTIRPQVLSAIQGSTSATDVIVTTKGMPLRITVGQSPPTAPWPTLPTYVDPSGATRSILSWKPVSSLESELALIDTVSSWTMMGDQSYSLQNHFSANPYYGSNAAFSHAAFGTRLTSRLDGFSVADVTASLNRAQNAFVGPNNSPNGPYHFLVDGDPTKSYATTMTNLVSNVLGPAGLPVTYNTTTAFASTAGGPVIGYVGHGANQASTPPLNPNLTPPSYLSSLNVTLANGAVFDTWESFNAESFNQGANHGNQALIGDWLVKGGTAAVGNVAEPGASPSSVVNENLLFQGLLNGKTFAEAAWSSTRQLSYVNTMVGDPLMTWKQLLPGDCNRDGQVGISDLSLMGANWNRSVASGGAGWWFGDINCDGVVGIADLALLGANWGRTSPWALSPASTGDVTATQLAMLVESLGGTVNIPEPASVISLVVGAATLAGYAWRKRRRRARGTR